MDLDRAAMSRMLDDLLAESLAGSRERAARSLAEISDHYMQWPEPQPAPPPAQVTNYGVSTFDHAVLPRSSMVEDRRWDRRADRAADMRDAIRERVNMAEHADFMRRGEPYSPVLGPGDMRSSMDPMPDDDERIGFASGGVASFPSDDDPEAALRAMAAEIPEPPRQPSTLDRLAQTWPARLAQDAWSAATLPRDVATGRVSHADLYEPDSRLQERMLGLGSIPMVATTGAPRGALGAGLVRPSQNFPAPVAEPIRAYHGSPHDFDRFRMSAMGTGEGAQAYGPGLYFAEREGTARQYRDQLAFPSIAGSPIDIRNPVHRVALDIHRSNRTPDAIRHAAIQNYLDTKRSTMSYLQDAGVLGPQREETLRYLAEMRRNALAEARATRQLLPPVGSTGRMYEVDIHARPSQVLDFDRGMWAQPPGVQQMLVRQPGVLGKNDEHIARLGRERDYLNQLRWSDSPDAGQIERQARRVAQMEEGLPIADIVSQMRRGMRPDRYLDQMRDMGVLATRYLDQGSRGLAPSDPRRSHNLVVHDDRIIDILRKYGLAGAAATPVAGAYLGSDARGD